MAIKEEEEPKSTSMDEMNAVSSASIQSDDAMDDEDVLPKGWAEATDPNSGQVYYYHEVRLRIRGGNETMGLEQAYIEQ